MHSNGIENMQIVIKGHHKAERIHPCSNPVGILQIPFEINAAPVLDVQTITVFPETVYVVK